MSENNFEKQVQRKMEDLKVNPSKQVWDKVSTAIERKPTDRKLIYIFSLLVLLIGGSLAWWNFGGENKVAFRHGKTVKKETKNVEAKIESLTTADKKIVQNNKTQQDLATTKIPSNTADITAPPVSSRTQEPVINKETSVSREIGNANAPRKNNNSKSTKHSSFARTNASITAGEVVETVEQLQVVRSSMSPFLFEPVLQSVPYFKKRIVIKRNALLLPVELQASTLPGQSAKKDGPLKKKNRKGIDWGFSLSGGVSAARSNYLGIGNASAMDDMAYYAPIPNNNSGNNSSVPIVYPKSGKPGLGMVLGIYAQRDLTPKTSLMVSLNYKYYSTKLTIGTRVDSSFNNGSNAYYYRYGHSKQHKNQFHFVELPVGFSFSLGKDHSKFPVQLYTGITLSQLVKTNALQMQQSSGSYYEDDALFNKTQVDLSMRLMFSLQRKNPQSLMIGPQLSYALTKMAREGLYKSRHYSYLGIQLQKGIGKK